MAFGTSTRSLFKLLETHGFWYKYEIDATTSRLRYLMWVHKATMVFFHSYPDVLVLDCTYKTNKFNLPLLNIVSVTDMNTVLPVAQRWLPGEGEADFTWALTTLRQLMDSQGIRIPRVIITDRDLACMNALCVVFCGVPSMVCRWHMNRNVLARTRQVLGQVRVEDPGPFEDKYRNTWETDVFMAKYHEAAGAQTEEKFETTRAELSVLSPSLADYLDKHWWKYKEHLVAYWTNKYSHFGLHDTSVVEGTHAKIKRWIQTSRCDLLTVFQKILPWWALTAQSLSLQVSKDATITPHRLQNDAFSAIVRVVTVWALVKTEEIWAQAKAIVAKNIGMTECSGIFKAVHGRPCVHILIRIVKSNGVIKLQSEDFNKHWWIHNSSTVHEEAPRVLEPASLIQMRRTVRNSTHRPQTGVTSTRREPTLAEMVDRNHASPQPTPWQPVRILSSLGVVMEGLAAFSVTPHGYPARQWGNAGLYP